MNYDMAWKEFEDSGKIESYLKYRKLKQQKSKDLNEEIGLIKGDISEDIQSKGDSN